MAEKILLIFILFILFTSCTNKKKEETNKNVRWYGSHQVDTGKKIYASNCISCHNKDAIGSFNWKKQLPDGRYPPPALNGDAHTWHHSFKYLKDIISKGGGSGSKMPSFSKTLSKKDIEDVLAYVQDKWDDRVYEAWMRISGLNNKKDNK